MSFVWNAIKNLGGKAIGFIRGMNGKKAGAFLGGLAGRALNYIPYVGPLLSGAVSVPAAALGSEIGKQLEDKLFNKISDALEEEHGWAQRQKPWKLQYKGTKPLRTGFLEPSNWQVTGPGGTSYTSANASQP